MEAMGGSGGWIGRGDRGCAGSRARADTKRVGPGAAEEVPRRFDTVTKASRWRRAWRGQRARATRIRLSVLGTPALRVAGDCDLYAASQALTSFFNTCAHKPRRLVSMGKPRRLFFMPACLTSLFMPACLTSPINVRRRSRGVQAATSTSRDVAGRGAALVQKSKGKKKKLLYWHTCPS